MCEATVDRDALEPKRWPLPKESTWFAGAVDRRVAIATVMGDHGACVLVEFSAAGIKAEAG